VLAELAVDEVVDAVEHAAIVLLGGVEHGGVRLEREGDQLAEPRRRAGGRRREPCAPPRREGLRPASCLRARLDRVLRYEALSRKLVK